MYLSRFCLLFVAALWCVAGLETQAASTDREGEEIAALKARVAALEEQLTSVQRGQIDDWQNERRREEVRQLIHEVLEDSQTRASLLDSALNAGYDNGFFITNEDQTFLMKFNAILQVRYIYNHTDSGGMDDDDAGFVIRRSELYINGHLYDPKLFYQFSGGFDRSTGDFNIVSTYLGYKFDDVWQVRAGQFYAPFMAEQLLSIAKQLTVERSLMTHMFSVGTGEGVEVQRNTERLRLAAMVHDGTWSNTTDYFEDTTDVAVTGRAEYLLAGEWSQFADPQGWAGGQFAARLGAAGDYEIADDHALTADADQIKYTADLHMEGDGWGVFIALAGRHFNPVPMPDDRADQFGFQVQAGVFVIPDKVEVYGRYEYIELDGWRSVSDMAVFDQIDVYTAGFNWFLHSHNAKVVFDVMYLPDGLDAASSSTGLAATDGDQVVFRGAFHVRY